jgi:hypothetical protein
MSFSLMPESDNAKPVILDDSHTLASYGISDGDTVHVVATCDPYYKRTIVSPKPTDNYFYNGSIQPYDLCMSPDSKHLFVVDRARKCVHVYRSEDGAHVLKPKRAGVRFEGDDEKYVPQPDDAAYMLQTDDGKYMLQTEDGRDIMKVRDPREDDVLGFDEYFRYPISACISSDGTTIFLSDFHQCFVLKINMSNGEIVDMGKPGKGAGMLNYPIGICMTNDELFVAEKESHRIQVFDLNGKFKRKFGSKGKGPGQFNEPSGICLSPDNNTLFVVDEGNNRIQVFNIDGTFIRTFGSKGSGPEQFNSPHHICLSKDGELLFVSDYHNHRVQVLGASDGKYMYTIGKEGTGEGEFIDVFGLCVSNNELFVAGGDSRNYIGNVQVFDISNMSGGRRKRVRRTQRKKKGKGRKYTKRRRTNRH